MSDIGRTPASPRHAAPPGTSLTRDGHDRWHDLVAQMGAEIAAPLTAALEHINALTSTGRIDRQGLRALRDEVEAARQAGMIGQQLTRFASGRLRQSHERVRLADIVAGVIAHRAREAQARGIRLTPALKPAEVIVDASLLFSLISTLFDWALSNAHAHIDLALDVHGTPAHARLGCRFAHRPSDEFADGSGTTAPRGLDSLSWRLLEQTAWTMGLVVERKDAGHATTLTLEFPRTASSVIEGVSALELNDGFAPSTNSQPLAGSHLLVISSHRDLRRQIREALRGMSLIVDYVDSVDEAVAFCDEGLPHAVLVESSQNGERFAAFREQVSAEVPDFVFVEIVEDGAAFDMSGFSGSTMARVGRDVLATSLPSSLMFELTKGL